MITELETSVTGAPSVASSVLLGVMALVSVVVAVRCCYPKDSWRLGFCLPLLAPRRSR